MSTNSTPKLSTRDSAILETMLFDHAGEAFFVEAIRQKLQTADVISAAAMPDNVVRIGSRLVFAIDDGWPQERRLVHQKHYVPGQNCQTIASFRGVAMLGLAEGGQAEIRYPGRTETIEIHQVLSRPESRE